ncbi:hypothetical protein ABH991_005799 [Bradyrhizobium ottawaense]|jgi:hypothetical protein|uniref:Uncharacterized protein n=1 Tax=Bradyrhizobium ottawaense TaxID=931866 RepID=A0ABV4G614_9BRAD|nr:hypothetical protein BwSF12_13440 [Bradyrhizobium ottawaense]GMO81376.1 hypothetical protein BwSG20_61420 [Bradyrhizobium ottawaense]GMP08077.1 hypothetical protein BwSH20_54740 [Bradyrhizobium ottawaense]
MPGPVPGIHVHRAAWHGRDEPGMTLWRLSVSSLHLLPYRLAASLSRRLIFAALLSSSSDGFWPVVAQRQAQ